MRRISSLFLVALVFALLAPTRGFAAKNPADYPLRVHIFSHNSVSHYSGYGGIKSLNDVDGEGRANLYENSQPRGFDFKYECEERLMNSMGYETYPARWKKPNVELELLLPVSGKTCKFRVAMKDGIAYYKHNGDFGEEPAEKFKAWMVKYQYDPEHGQNTITKPTEVAASSLNPSDFPLRIHIFSHTGVSHYATPQQTGPEVVDGEGRANLYEGGLPRGFDFSYRCQNRLMDSMGYETYLARWKTQGKELEIMQPAVDKTCVINVAMKEHFAYSDENGPVQLESAADFKKWMDKSQYDPEHGKDLPVKAPGGVQ
jgi:hypothetical protein